MKIHGGIKGIVNNQLAQDQNFILTPELSSIIEKFTHSSALPIPKIKNTIISLKEVKIRGLKIM